MVKKTMAINRRPDAMKGSISRVVVSADGLGRRFFRIDFLGHLLVWV